MLMASNVYRLGQSLDGRARFATFAEKTTRRCSIAAQMTKLCLDLGVAAHGVHQAVQFQGVHQHRHDDAEGCCEITSG